MLNKNYQAKANRAWSAAVTLRELINDKSKLYQNEAVEAIRASHGDEFIYQNQNGPAIDRHVLGDFEMFTQDEIVWAKAGQYWRYRRENDPTDRREVRF